jgi:hypothetical protein
VQPVERPGREIPTFAALEKKWRITSSPAYTTPNFPTLFDVERQLSALLLFHPLRLLERAAIKVIPRVTRSEG